MKNDDNTLCVLYQIKALTARLSALAEAMEDMLHRPAQPESELIERLSWRCAHLEELLIAERSAKTHG